MNKYIFLAAMFSLVAIISTIILYGGEREPAQDVIKKIEERASSGNPSENQELIQQSPTTQSAGSSSTGSSQSESSSVPSPSQQTENCNPSQVPYALENLEVASICNVLEEEICIDRTTSCSLDVTNLHNTAGGQFTIIFSYTDANQQTYIIDTETISFNIAPQETLIFESETNVQSQGSQGDANRETTCSFSSEEIPTIC